MIVTIYILQCYSVINNIYHTITENTENSGRRQVLGKQLVFKAKETKSNRGHREF